MFSWLSRTITETNTEIYTRSRDTFYISDRKELTHKNKKGRSPKMPPFFVSSIRLVLIGVGRHADVDEPHLAV